MSESNILEIRYFAVLWHRLTYISSSLYARPLGVSNTRSTLALRSTYRAAHAWTIARRSLRRAGWRDSPAHKPCPCGDDACAYACFAIVTALTPGCHSIATVATATIDIQKLQCTGQGRCSQRVCRAAAIQSQHLALLYHDSVSLRCFKPGGPQESASIRIRPFA